MEIIRKKINLDNFRSHINGALDYVGSAYDDSGNFGGFVKDAVNTILDCGWSGNTLNISGETVIRTTEMMRRYNILMNILRNSTHVKHSKNLSCKDTNQYYNKFYLDFDYNGTTEDFFFKENIGVLFESGFTFNGNYYTYNGNESEVAFDYVILISDEDAVIYEKYFGFDFVKEVHTIAYSDDSRFTEPPFIPINVLLTSNVKDVGLMTLYEDDDLEYDILIDGDTKEEYKEFPLDYDNNNNLDRFEKQNFELYLEEPVSGYETFTDNQPRLESKLTTLRDKIYIQDDNGKTLPAIFEDLNQFYKVTCREREEEGVVIKYWEISHYSHGENLSCADGEEVMKCRNKDKYRTQTVYETFIKELLRTPAAVDDFYYFLVKYDNSSSVPARIPYTEGAIFNKDAYEFEEGITYTADKILKIDDSEAGYISFTYVLGAVFSDSGYTNYTGGTIYNEKYAYNENIQGEISLDGFDEVRYWYNSIDFDGSKEYIENSDLNLSKYGNISYINGLTTGDVWKKDGTVYNSPIIKEDYLMGISMNGITDIDVEINRGNAAAFESHFRLSECNSISDIEDNGNGGFYNIE